jgi:TetR/AcrR family transcriptional repressor of nem operon
MGRRKNYERSDVLGRAMQLFWLRGFEATSIADLAAAMGINKNTLYTEFGSKQALYEAALDHYLDRVVPQFVGEILQPDAGLEAIHAVFDRFGAAAGQPGTERGCMACNAATELAQADLGTRALVARYVDTLTRGFRTCLDNAVTDGTLRSDTDTAAESHRLTTTLMGMFVLVRAQLDGATARATVRATLDSLA